MAERLEARGGNEHFNGFIDAYLENLGLRDGDEVLDFGCGTGVVARRIRERVPGVKVTGVDISERLLQVAREESGGGIEWVKSEDGLLPFEEERFDCVVLHTLVSHVPDVVATLREAARVLKAGKVMVVFDADYASTTYGVRDFSWGRETDWKLLGAVVNNLDVCRQLPRFVREAELELSGMDSHVIGEAGRGDFWLSSVQGFAKLIPAMNILPADEGKRWVEEMIQSHEEGTFFATGNYYTYRIQKS